MNSTYSAWQVDEYATRTFRWVGNHCSDAVVFQYELCMQIVSSLGSLVGP